MVIIVTVSYGVFLLHVYVCASSFEFFLFSDCNYMPSVNSVSFSLTLCSSSLLVCHPSFMCLFFLSQALSLSLSRARSLPHFLPPSRDMPSHSVAAPSRRLSSFLFFFIVTTPTVALCDRHHYVVRLYACACTASEIRMDTYYRHTRCRRHPTSLLLPLLLFSVIQVGVQPHRSNPKKGHYLTSWMRLIHTPH